MRIQAIPLVRVDRLASSNAPRLPDKVDYNRHNYRSSSADLRRRRRRRRRRSLLLLVPVLAVLFVLVVVGIGFAGSSDRIAAGVRIAGMNVGGLTPAQARQKLKRAFGKVAWVPVELRAGNKQVMISPAQLGVSIDWPAAINSARNDGDKLGPLQGFKRLEMRLVGVDVTPSVSLSQPALKLLLSQIGRSVDHPEREPAIVLDGSEPSIVSGHNGLALNRPVAARLISRALGSFSREPVTLPIGVTTPKVQRSDLIRVMGQIRTAVSAPVLINLGAVRWRISPAQIEKMLVYPHGGQRSLSVTSDKRSSYLRILSKQLDEPARDASFEVSGLSVRIVPSRPGRGVDPVRTAASILRAALDPANRIASVEMKMTEPKRTTAQAKMMGITGLVGHYETSFGGVANRIHNVELVSSLIDNKFIAPGEVFSFNKTTGERNAKKGFLSAPVIINGKLAEGLGGGVCQVSTTLFNAAYEAGLKIVARRNHALYISHYPLGRDATVDYPDTDLKFLNDTGHWLLLRTFANSDTLLVVLFGTPQHRRIVSHTSPLRITGPPPLKKIFDPNLPVGTTVVDDPGQPSSSTSVHRLVYKANGKLLYDSTFYSSYVSSPKIVQVGTKKPEKKKPKKTGTTSTGATTGETTVTTSPSPGAPPPSTG